MLSPAPPAAPPLLFDTSFRAEPGVPAEVAPGVVRVVANNASAYTFTGTNAYLVGHDSVGIVDPGPDNDAHLKALLDAVGGRTVEAVILTHTHKDHSALAARLSKVTGAPLWFEGRHRALRPAGLIARRTLRLMANLDLRPDRILADGERFTVGGVKLKAVATPGHCANHLCLSVEDTGWMLTGDHVMAWSSSLVAPPDGALAEYLASLDRLIKGPWSRYLPGHGGPVWQGRPHAAGLKAHRFKRLEQIVAGVRAGDRGPQDLLVRLYGDQPPAAQLATRWTLNAHVDYLVETGRLKRSLGRFGRLLPGDKA